MLSKREDPIPIHALRDLLGLARAIYLAERRGGAPPERLRRIAEVGRDLADAISMAKNAKPNTLAYFAAWKAAEAATHACADIADVLTPAQPIVTAAVARIHGQPARKRSR